MQRHKCGTPKRQAPSHSPRTSRFRPERAIQPARPAIVTAGDQSGRVWEAESGKLITTLQGHKTLVTSLQFSPDEQHIVTTSTDVTARMWHIAQVWETQSGKLLATLQGHQGEIKSAQFSPDGQRIVTASWDKTARVWETQTGKLLVTLEGHRAFVNSAQFSSDGRRVVTASRRNGAGVGSAERQAPRQSGRTSRRRAVRAIQPGWSACRYGVG